MPLCFCYIYYFTVFVVSQPQSVAVLVGDTATFSITVQGTNPSYKWFGPDENMLSDSNGVIEGATTATLQILNTQLSDGGTYRVRVLVGDGSVDEEAILTIGEFVTALLYRY